MRPFTPVLYFTSDDELYYSVTFRKYYHFEPIEVITSRDDLCNLLYSGIIPQVDCMLYTVQVPADSIFVAHTFSVAASKCKDGIDKYIKDNLDRFETSDVWDNSDNEILSKYISDINRRYDIELDIKAPIYTNQFCWEV